MITILDPIFISDCLVTVPDYIDRVVSLLTLNESQWQIPTERLNNKSRVQVPLNDPSSLDSDSFKSAIDLILEWVKQDKKVLIHCASCQNRSPAVACCAYARLKDISIEEAVAKLKEVTELEIDEEYLAMAQFFNDEFS